MAEAKEFVRKMNIVSTKDKDDKSEDAASDAGRKVSQSPTMRISNILGYFGNFA
jgi:hypothetical protein